MLSIARTPTQPVASRSAIESKIARADIRRSKRKGSKPLDRFYTNSRPSWFLSETKQLRLLTKPCCRCPGLLLLACQNPCLFRNSTVTFRVSLEALKLTWILSVRKVIQIISSFRQGSHELGNSG